MAATATEQIKNEAVSIEDAQYIAGFFDGDGCILLPTRTINCANPLPILSVKQAHANGSPPEFVILSRCFGVTIYRELHPTRNWRTSWTLRIHTKEALTRLLEVVRQYGVVKRPQAILALEYLNNNRSNPAEYARLIEQAKHQYQEVDIDVGRLTPPYLAGLFAAEGYIGFVAMNWVNSFALRSAISQPGCTRLLRCIRESLGYGSVGKLNLEFSTAQTVNFVQLIRPHMKDCQKVAQMDLVLQFVATRTSGTGRKRTLEDDEKLQNMAKRMKELKRQ